MCRRKRVQRQLLRVIAIGLVVVTTGMGTASATAFEIVVIPDSQKYGRVEAEGGPSLFVLQTEWITKNVAAENIVFVTHVGDVIQDNNYNYTDAWAYASEVMSVLDGVVPYSVTFGNHDPGETRDTFFGHDRYDAEPWYLGHSDDDWAHAQTFNGGGIDFLHINLPHVSGSAHLTWGQGIIDAHGDMPTIISTHGYMADNAWGRSSAGNNIWNALVEPNAQVFMTLNGHDWVSRHEINTAMDGRKVVSIQANWQEIINGGNAMLQRIIFDPDNSQIRVNSYSPFLDLFHTDWTGEFAFSATFNGSANITINGELGPAHRSWTGAGNDNYWGTADNWGGTVPIPGEVLRFRNTDRKISTNNLPAGTAFAGMVFEPGTFSDGFNFFGNAITLSGDIVNMGGYGPDMARSGPKVDVPIILDGDRQVNTGDWDMTLGGVISGSGSLTKTHGRDYIRGSMDGGVVIGDLYLTAVNTYTGETRVTGGALILDNDSSSNPIAASTPISLYLNSVLEVSNLLDGTMTLATGQILRGTGRVLGNTTAGGGSTISPGLDVPGVLVQMGDLSMNTGAALNIRIGDLSAGEYDRIDLEGQASLGGATLNLVGVDGQTSQIGDEVIMIDNDLADPVEGILVSGLGSSLPTGTDLPEGTIVSTNIFGSGRLARISYQSGDGNDVGLVILPSPGSPVLLRRDNL